MNHMNKKSRAIAISILIAAVVIGGAVIYAGTSQSHNQPSGNNPVPAARASAPSVAGEPFIGDPKAPLTLYYWHDFQCPFCGRFDTQTLPALVSEYVNTGKLRVMFKDFVFLGPDSETAAEMSRAVWDAASSSYDAWQNTVYAHQGTEGSGWAAART